jgi:hypothetical protein
LVGIQNLVFLELFKLLAVSNRKEKKREKSKKIEKGWGYRFGPGQKARPSPASTRS